MNKAEIEAAVDRWFPGSKAYVESKTVVVFTSGVLSVKHLEQFRYELQVKDIWVSTGEGGRLYFEWSRR